MSSLTNSAQPSDQGSLVLQTRERRRSSWLPGGLSSVVAGAGACLVSASPHRPAPSVAEVPSRPSDQRRE
jgi:hypothetical protein